MTANWYGFFFFWADDSILELNSGNSCTIFFFYYYYFCVCVSFYPHLKQATQEQGYICFGHC